LPRVFEDGLHNSQRSSPRNVWCNKTTHELVLLRMNRKYYGL
jgi:hypothetical protein